MKKLLLTTIFAAFVLLPTSALSQSNLPKELLVVAPNSPFCAKKDAIQKITSFYEVADLESAKEIFRTEKCFVTPKGLLTVYGLERNNGFILARVLPPFGLTNQEIYWFSEYTIIPIGALDHVSEPDSEG